jgi:hypothetical protein
MPTCTSTFVGAEDDLWGIAANWTNGVPGGLSSFGCIPSTYPDSVIFRTSSEAATALGGVWADNIDGITFQAGHLVLADPEHKSRITNVKPGNGSLTLAGGVTLELTGTTGEVGGIALNGPGTLEIPRQTTLRTGKCASWKGRKRNKCIDGTPTPGHEGLQVKNFGKIFGAGISLCRNIAGRPAVLENEGIVSMKKSGGFGSASECGEVGSVINGGMGLIKIANDDGLGCNVRVGIGRLLNQGLLELFSCLEPETEEVQRPTLEIASSLTEPGTIVDAGILQIQGDYEPTTSSDLTISIRQTFPAGSPETNYGTVEVSGNATLAGELNVETDRFQHRPLLLGQKFQIVAAGEITGALSGEFRLGNHCIPTEPGTGYKVDYDFGSKGTVTLEVARVADC